MPLFEQDKLTPRQQAKLEAWKRTKQLWTLLRDIHKDIANKKSELRQRDAIIEGIAL